MNGSKNVVGIDIAKRVFQLHWIDMETGEIEVGRNSRSPLGQAASCFA